MRAITPEEEHRALLFCMKWHGEQTRKYTRDPYWTHPQSVAQIVKTVTNDYDMIVSAYLHDVLEDTACTLNEIEKNFGVTVACFVEDLTDHFTKENYPELNRAERKFREAVRLGTKGYEVQTVKLADITDNTFSIVKHDPNFARVYLAEKRTLLKFLTEGNDILKQRAQLIVNL